MSKQKDRNELMRYGNFIVEGIVDKDGHMTFIEIRAVSNNWKMRVDEGTLMFGLLKDASMHSKDNEGYKQMNGYLNSVISVTYTFGTSGIPIEMLVELDKLLTKYYKSQIEPTSKKISKEEKEILDEYRMEYHMKEEFKKSGESK